MPMQATLSLYGLYQYDNTLLDGLKAAVPDGVDADNVADTLLLESAGLEILYSNPVFMKAAVTVWANEKRDIWQKLYDTTLLEYNPIDNYDRYETSTREVTGTGETGSSSTTVVDATTGNTETGNYSGTVVVDGTTGNSETVDYSGTNSGTNSVTNSNTSYDSDTLKVTGKSDTTGSNTDTRTTETTATTDTDSTTTDTRTTGTTATTDTDSTTTDTTSGTSEFSNTDSFTSHIHGNIGVTTAMKMIEEQREVVQFCLTEYICNEFLDKFTVGVY